MVLHSSLSIKSGGIVSTLSIPTDTKIHTSMLRIRALNMVLNLYTALVHAC